MSKGKIINLSEQEYFNNPKFKSDEILEEAYEATSKSSAIKLAKQALDVYPDNIDAAALIAEFEENPIKKIKKLEPIIEHATKLLEEQNMFNKENIGAFWGILETRPYMRIRHNKMITLLELGRYKEAIKEAEELLELCNNDNLGVRYILISLYCTLEEFEQCEKLYKKFNDDSVEMLLPMAIMYFKQGNYKKTKEYLKKVEVQNEFVIDFLIGEDKETLNSCAVNYYSHGSEEEAFMLLHDLTYLLGSVPSFIAFIYNDYRRG